MEAEEMRTIAQALVNEVPVEDGAKFMEVLFEVMDESLTQEQKDVLVLELLEIGIDFRPICKRKHPTP